MRIFLKANCIKCELNASHIFVCLECANTYYIKADPSLGCVTNCSADTTGMFGYANYSAGGLWKCI